MTELALKDFSQMTGIDDSLNVLLDEADGTSIQALEINHLLGVFFLLSLGIVIAAIAFGFETLNACKK